MHRLTIGTMGLARPLAGRRVFPLWAVLEHRGRSSGTAYRTPIVARRTADGFVIPVPFGPTTNWLRNVQAARRATLTWSGREWALSDPRLTDLDGARPALNPLIVAISRRVGIVTWVTVRAAPAEADATGTDSA